VLLCTHTTAPLTTKPLGHSDAGVKHDRRKLLHNVAERAQ